MADEGSNRDRRTGAESPEFPSRSEAKSLTQLAEDDLQATLQLLAERAQYITGASGSAIALLEQEAMICRARTGPSAPELGSQLRTDRGEHTNARDHALRQRRAGRSRQPGKLPTVGYRLGDGDAFGV